MKKIITKLFVLGFISLMTLMLFACNNNTHLGVWYRIEHGVRTGVSKELTSDGMWSHTQLGSGGFRRSGDIIRFYTLEGFDSPTAFRSATLTGDQMHVVNLLTTGTAIYERADAVVQEFTITFNTGGGTNVAPITAPASTLVQAPTPPTRPGFIFDGWEDINGNRRTFPHLLTANITLHAIWEVDVGGSPITPCGLFYMLVNNEVWITGRSTSNTTITVPSLVNGLPVRRINDEAFAYSNITSVIIPSSVTSIGYAAFFDTWNLSIVTLNTGLITIEDHAFAATRINSIVIPSTVTSIGQEAFAWNWNLASVTLNEGLLIIGDGAFMETSISTISIPSTVTSIGAYAFDPWVVIIGGPEDISGLVYEIVDNEIWITGFDSWLANSTAINIPSFIEDMPVTRIHNHAFAYTDITSVVIPSTVRSIGVGAFAENWNLMYVKLNEGLEIIDIAAFAGNHIDEIAIPSSVTTIAQDAFAWNWNLSSVTLNEGLQKIGAEAFIGTSISDLIIPSTVTSIGSGAFASTWNLTSLTLNEGLLTIGDGAFAETAISELIIPSTVTSIGGSAFAHAYNLASVTFNEGLQTIGARAFRYTNIDVIRLPSTVLSIGSSAFEFVGATSLTLNEGLQIIGNLAFADVRITEIIIPSTVITISDGAFAHAYNLASVTLNDGLQIIGAGAFVFTSITEILIPATITSLDSQAFPVGTRIVYLP